MSFTVATADLVNAAELCKIAVSTRTTLPVLMNIKIEFLDGFAFSAALIMNWVFATKSHVVANIVA